MDRKTLINRIYKAELCAQKRFEESSQGLWSQKQGEKDTINGPEQVRIVVNVVHIALAHDDRVHDE